MYAYLSGNNYQLAGPGSMTIDSQSTYNIDNTASVQTSGSHSNTGTTKSVSKTTVVKDPEPDYAELFKDWSNSTPTRQKQMEEYYHISPELIEGYKTWAADQPEGKDDVNTYIAQMNDKVLQNL